jgi:CubicO group peptidase (beta-lactamase class C family)
MKLNFRNLIFLCALFVCSGVVLASDNDSTPDGLWLGVADAESGAMRFDIEFSVENEQLQALFILHSEGGMRLPAESAEVDGDSIRLVTMDGAVVLDGRLDGDQAEGTLRFPTMELNMRLAREGSDEATEMIDRIEREIAALREEPLQKLRSGPGMERIDEAALEELLEAAEASYTTGLALMHDGELVGEWYRGDQEQPVQTMSVTKAALHLIIGRLVTLNKLESIDLPVYHFYPQWADDEQRSSITIRHLLAHTSGVDRGQPAGPIYQSDDFAQFALDAPLEFEPGSQVVYSNNGTNLLGGIVGQLIDQPLEEFLADDLFGLLGIDSFAWSYDRAGNPHGMAGLVLTAGDLALLGQLALNRGEWNGQQLIDADWFDQSFQPGSEHSQRFGLIWFLDREDDELVGASHSGYLGQFLGIRFDNGMVGARMIANSPAYDSETDGFRDFVGRLASLPSVEP